MRHSLKEFMKRYGEAEPFRTGGATAAARPAIFWEFFDPRVTRRNPGPVISERFQRWAPYIDGNCVQYGEATRSSEAYSTTWNGRATHHVRSSGDTRSRVAQSAEGD
jgi:hypothetical protein